MPHLAALKSMEQGGEEAEAPVEKAPREAAQ
jgi:hypothetical protein